MKTGGVLQTMMTMLLLLLMMMASVMASGSSLPFQLADGVLHRIFEEIPGFALVHNETLFSIAPQKQEVGWLRIWKDSSTKMKLVNVALIVPFLQLDTHMIFTFTPAASVVPHFTVDCVSAGTSYAFHIDLLHRVELATNIKYIDSVYTAIVPVIERTNTIPGLSDADLTITQLAIMSNWMMAKRATEEAFIAITDSVHAYLDHWFNLLKQNKGIIDRDAIFPSDATESLGAHDKKHREILFSYVDPVWYDVDLILGEEKSAEIREILREVEY